MLDKLELRIRKTAERVKNGEQFFVVFKEKIKGKNKYNGIIAGNDGRSVQFYNNAAKQWESFSLYELFHILGGKIEFKRIKK